MALYKNFVLSSLLAAGQNLIQPHLTKRNFRRGEVLAEASDAIDCVYFPESGVVGEVLGWGRDSAQVGMIGVEGMLGSSSINGATRAPFRSIVVQPVEAYCLSLPCFLDACRLNPEFGAAAQGFTHRLTNQIAANMLVAIRAGTEARLARYLSMIHDRMGGDLIRITHDVLAAALASAGPVSRSPCMSSKASI